MKYLYRFAVALIVLGFVGTAFIGQSNIKR